MIWDGAMMKSYTAFSTCRHQSMLLKVTLIAESIFSDGRESMKRK